MLCYQLLNPNSRYKDSITDLGPFMNGVELELGITSFLEGFTYIDWYRDVFEPLQNWEKASVRPPASGAIAHYSITPIFDPTDEQLEAGRISFQRVRFGLVTALLTDAAFIYDITFTYEAQGLYWYDKYDNSGTQEPGYLGKPIGEPFLVDELVTPNLISNSSFESTAETQECGFGEGIGLASWCEEDHFDVGVLQQDCTVAHDGNCSLKVMRPTSQPIEHYQFQLRQNNFQVFDGRVYTISFWARAEQPRQMAIQITRDIPEWIAYSEYVTANVSTEWQQYEFVLHIHVPNGEEPPSPEVTRLAIFLGQALPTLWIDDIQLQEGIAGIY